MAVERSTSELKWDLKELDDRWEALDHTGRADEQERIVKDMEEVRKVLRARGVDPEY